MPLHCTATRLKFLNVQCFSSNPIFDDQDPWELKKMYFCFFVYIWVLVLWCQLCSWFVTKSVVLILNCFVTNKNLSAKKRQRLFVAYQRNRCFPILISAGLHAIATHGLFPSVNFSRVFMYFLDPCAFCSSHINHHGLSTMGSILRNDLHPLTPMNHVLYIRIYKKFFGLYFRTKATRLEWIGYDGVGWQLTTYVVCVRGKSQNKRG